MPKKEKFEGIVPRHCLKICVSFKRYFYWQKTSVPDRLSRMEQKEPFDRQQSTSSSATSSTTNGWQESSLINTDSRSISSTNHEIRSISSTVYKSKSASSREFSNNATTLSSSGTLTSSANSSKFDPKSSSVVSKYSRTSSFTNSTSSSEIFSTPFGNVNNGTANNDVDMDRDVSDAPVTSQNLEATWNTTLEEQMMIMARIEAESQKIKRSKSVSAANFMTSSHDVKVDAKPTKYLEEMLVPALDVPAEAKVRFKVVSEFSFERLIETCLFKPLRFDIIQYNIVNRN